VPLLRESLKTNPNHAELHWELGYAYRFAGMLEESVAECELARKLDPGVKINSSALNAYLYIGDYDKFLQSLPRNSELPFSSLLSRARRVLQKAGRTSGGGFRSFVCFESATVSGAGWQSTE